MSQFGEMLLVRDFQLEKLTWPEWRDVQGPILDFTDELVSYGIPSVLAKYQIGKEVEVIKEVILSQPIREVWCVGNHIVVDLLKTC
jgi:hypothetical protein